MLVLLVEMIVQYLYLLLYPFGKTFSLWLKTEQKILAKTLCWVNVKIGGTISA